MFEKSNVFNPLQIFLVAIVHFKHEISLDFPKLGSWSEIDLKYLFSFASARSFHQYSILEIIFKNVHSNETD